MKVVNLSGYVNPAIPTTGCAPPPLNAVSANVTGVPCPLPATFSWNGGNTTLTEFIRDVQAQVAGAAYNAATCSFTAPAGSTFPVLTIAPVVQANAVITPTPTAFPVLFLGVRYQDMLSLKSAIDAYYGATTCYNAATGVLTQLSGECVIPPAIPVEINCGFFLAGDVVSLNSGSMLFRRVLAQVELLPLAAFAEFRNNGGVLISLLSIAVGEHCGIVFDVPVSANGALIGYGAKI